MPTPIDYAPAPLKRQVGLLGAVLLGLGSMIGTGVFIGLGQATEIAGPWVLVAVLIAAGLALCNALSSAQLAAVFPVAGGTYEYGYRTLTPALGFTAGWTFLLAKTASAATAAMGVAWAIMLEVPMRIAPGAWIETPVPFVALGLTVALTLLVVCGVRKTNTINALLLVVSIAGLFTFAAAFLGTAPVGVPLVVRSLGAVEPVPGDLLLQASAICFVAFTGYGRLATLGEEVHEPRKTIPRAIILTVSATLLIYLATAAAIHQARAQWPSHEYPSTGLVEIAQGRDGRLLLQVVTLAAITAMLGVLLNLILGLSRVWVAMGRRGDMPGGLAYVSPSGSPAVAVIVAGGFVAVMALIDDFRLTWSFSAFSVLIYYAITNLAALRLPREQRRYPRILAWIGLFTCAGLAWFVDREVWVAGTIAIGLGLVWHVWRGRFRRQAMPVDVARN